MKKATKKLNPSIVLIFAGFPLALAGGYGVGLMHKEGASFSGNAEAASLKATRENAEKASEGKSKAGKKKAEEVTAFSSQREWIERIRNAGVSDCEGLWKEVMEISDQYQRRAARELVYWKWVTLDPAGCMDFLAKTDPGQREQALTAWLKHDADGAYAWALADGDEAKVNDSARMVFQKLAQQDPRKFLALAASAKEEHLPGESIQVAFRKFAKTDPAAAVEALRGLGPKARSNGSWGLGVEWARTDPGSAFTWAQQLTEPAEKESALRGVLASWAKTDPDAAISHLDLLRKLPDAKGQDPMYAIVSGLSAKDPLKAMDFAIAHLSNQNERMEVIASQVIPKLAATMKPAEFAALMDRAGSVKGTPESGSSSYSEALMPKNVDYMGWGNYSSFPEDADPAGAFRQLTGGKLTPAQKYTAAAMAQQWAQKDTPAALAAYQSASDPETRELLSTALMAQVRSQNDLSLLSIVEGGVKQETRYWVDEIIRNQASGDPAKVLAWAEQLPADSKSRATALNSAIGAWASYDTGKALEYAQQRPAEEQPDLFKTISSTWAASDAYGNSQWVASLPEGINRDNAASSLIAQLSTKEPQSALTWARSLGDETIRNSSYENLFANWARRDPATALQALQSENLPPEQMGKIEKLIKQKPGR